MAEVWTTVKARRKDPGDPGGAQARKVNEVEVVEALAGFISKIRVEFMHSGRKGAFKA